MKTNFNERDYLLHKIDKRSYVDYLSFPSGFYLLIGRPKIYLDWRLQQQGGILEVNSHICNQI